MQKKLTEQGLKYLEAGQFKKAGQILSLLVKSFPDNPDAHHMLGIIELERGNFVLAEQLVQTAVSLSKTNAIFYNTLGNIEVRRRKYKQAEAAFLAAIQYEPEKIEYKYNLAHFYLSQSHYQKAIDFYYDILRYNPTHYLSIRGITVCYLFSSEPEIALEHATEWVNEFTIYDEPYYYLGLCHYAINDISAALQAYDHGLTLNPNNYDILTAIGACYRSMGNFTISETYLLKSLNLESNNPTAMYNLGCVKLDQGKVDNAQKIFLNTTALDKDYAEPICGLGYIELIKGNADLALDFFQKAHDAEPYNPKPALLTATTLLRQQQFAKGWLVYRETFAIPNIFKNISNWNGEKLDNSQILLVWVPKENYDIGQQIMFASMLPDLQKLVSNVMVLCDTKLIGILERSFPNYKFVDELDVFSMREQFETISYQIPLNALGQLFRRTNDDFTKISPSYLKYNTERKNQYREKYQQLFNNKKLIGIAWRATTDNQAIDHVKSINLNDLIPLFKKNDCQFISLQPQYQFSGHPEIYIDPETDATELSEQMASLDLIISVDNGIANLAGALGLDVYTLLCAHDQWYWFGDTHDSLWYPSMRLLKQQTANNWAPLVKELAHLI